MPAGQPLLGQPLLGQTLLGQPLLGQPVRLIIYSVHQLFADPLLWSFPFSVNHPPPPRGFIPNMLKDLGIQTVYKISLSSLLSQYTYCMWSCCLYGMFCYY
jgi:hypothetical protein